MSKTLTISIAAYNVEKYIREALDSLCVNEVIDDLEIFVVDDGGKDRTLEIAKEYANKYPDSIFPIHKENGGWGSTVNYSIEHATGKYFRLLDGDDHYDKDGLIKLIEIIKVIDSDVIYTPYSRFDDNTGEKIELFATSNVPINRIISISEAETIDFAMHAVTFKTSILKNNQIRISEHCFYTDNEYRAKGLAFCKSVYISDIEIYQYRVGRIGQSVDIDGLKKHYKDNLIVLNELVRFSKRITEEPNKSIILGCTRNAASFQYNTLLLLGKKDEAKELDVFLKKEGDEYYVTQDLLIRMLRKTGFFSFGLWSWERIIRSKLAPKIKIFVGKSPKH